MRIALGLPSRIVGASGELMLEWATRADRGPFFSLVVTDRVVSQALEPLAVLGTVDRVDGGADDGRAGGDEALGEVERGLAAELDDEAVDMRRGLVFTSPKRKRGSCFRFLIRMPITKTLACASGS